MKKVFFMLVAVAALSFAACTEEKKGDAPEAVEPAQTEEVAPEAGDSAAAAAAAAPADTTAAAAAAAATDSTAAEK